MVRIRPATAADLTAMMRIERESATAAHWAEDDYRRSIEAAEPPRMALVAEVEAKTMGFLVARKLGPEWEVENVVVTEGERRRGVGRALVQELLRQASAGGAESVVLEVRESNAAARALYRASGFREFGGRPGYYRDPEEDAILCRKRLGAAPESH
jgi:ribosomal-protein-alanine N-acetyltransferase